MKKNYKGDGLLFYTAVKKSGINNLDIQAAMNISNGKFYKLYDDEIFSDMEKTAAARALGKSVEEIFGNSTTAVPENDNNHVDNQLLGTKIAGVNTHQSNDQDMMHAMIEAQRDYAIAAKEAAMAARLNAETNKRLVAMLERGMLEGSVKQDPAVLK